MAERSGVSTASESATPVPAGKVSHRLILLLAFAVLLGFAAPRILLALLLAPFVLVAPGFLPTLVVLPNLSLPKRIGAGFGLTLFFLCYLGLVLAKFGILDKLLWAVLATVLLESLVCFRKIKRSWRRIALSSLPSLPVLKSWLRAHRKEIAVVSFLLTFSVLIFLKWENYSLIRADSGYFFWLAKQIDSSNQLVDNCPLLDYPVGKGAWARQTRPFRSCRSFCTGASTLFIRR